jgi:hypothetical protein
MVFGLPPFYNENLNEMYRGIISAPLTFPTDFPVAQELTDIIRGFLTRDPQVTICLIFYRFLLLIPNRAPQRRLGSKSDITEGAQLAFPSWACLLC